MSEAVIAADKDAGGRTFVSNHVEMDLILCAGAGTTKVWYCWT